jgi:hypothetical protein
MGKIGLISLSVLLLLVSCGKGPDAKNPETDTTDTIPAVTTTPEISDPDTTDQIPGHQYLIDAMSQETAAKVRARLESLLGEDLKLGIVDSLSRRFIFLEYDLNGDNTKEIFVGLTGPYFCGSGGCTQYILKDNGDVLTKFTVSDYPVVVAPDKTNGWSDLYIQSGGDYRVVKFDGKTYPSNPSVLPKLGMIPGDGLPRALDFMNDNYPWFSF